MELVQGNVFIREMRFERAGDVVNGHAHAFDHTTYVARGAVRIEQLRETKAAIYAELRPGEVFPKVLVPAEYEVARSVEKRASDGYNFVLIKAGVIHRLTALEDNSLGHCIYAHRNPQGEVVEAYDGWAPAYQ